MGRHKSLHSLWRSRLVKPTFDANVRNLSVEFDPSYIFGYSAWKGRCKRAAEVSLTKPSWRCNCDPAVLLVRPAITRLAWIASLELVTLLKLCHAASNCLRGRRGRRRTCKTDNNNDITPRRDVGNKPAPWGNMVGMQARRCAVFSCQEEPSFPLFQNPGVPCHVGQDVNARG